MTSELYVWTWLPGEVDPVVCGRLSISAGVPTGTFVYGKSFLARANRLPLDPIALPLRERLFEHTLLSGVPSALLDAAPDAWGLRLIDRIYGEQGGVLGYLRFSCDGVGNLGFSDSASAYSLPTEAQAFESTPLSLAELARIAQRVDAGDEVDRLPPHVLYALRPGTGGARPKAVLEAGGVSWIAKFPSGRDKGIVSVPKLEHFALALAATCGVQVVEHRLEQVGPQEVLLVRRFDREWSDKGWLRASFLSARTLFHANPQLQRYAFTGSYQRLATELKRYCIRVAENQRELLRRLCFNVIVGNTDDHELNHGLVWDRELNGYVLSPCFDVVPQLSRSAYAVPHALLIGEGAEGTRDNVISCAAAFDLSASEAANAFDTMSQQIRETWLDVAFECGFDDQECRSIEHVFSGERFLSVRPRSDSSLHP